MYTSAIWQHCSSLRPFLSMRHGLNDQFYLLYWGGKFHTTNRTFIVQIHKDKTAIQLCWQVISFFKTCRHLARLQPSRIQWKISKFATLSVTLLFLSLGYRWYCGLFLWKWMKNNPFLDASLLFSMKNPSDPDFWSDLGRL